METNQLLINYYKKEELKRVRERHQKGMALAEIIKLANKEYINEEEIKEALGIEDEKDIDNPEIKNLEDKKNDITEETSVIMIEESKLKDYPNQPFNLYKEAKKNEVMESIKINGIMQPLIVRPLGDNGDYQIIAGHNRRNCAKEIGIKRLPCIVKENLTDDEAIIYLIDTNLCTRDNISTMERARAYRLKYDTYKKGNIKATIIDEVEKDNLGTVRATIIKEEKMSNGNVQRYLRLTYLIPELQQLIEEGKISKKAGEQISFLPEQEQTLLSRIINAKRIKMTEQIAKRIRKQSIASTDKNSKSFLTEEEITEIMQQQEVEKVDVITIRFKREEIERYFPNCKTEKEIKESILNNYMYN